jgi:hypothetical protein
MTRDEWYKSPLFVKLRLVNNISHEIKHKAQHLYDLLAVLEAEHGPLMVYDKFNLAERQLKIVNLEATRLIEYMGRLDGLLAPKSFDEPPAEGQS